MTQTFGGGPAPLYVQLKESLRHDITTTLSPGDRVPSETLLIEQYGVSRTTVRLALAALTSEGLIVRKQGRGSFVSEPKRTVPTSPALLAPQPDAAVVTRLVGVDDTTPALEVSRALGATDDLVVRRIRWTEQHDDAGRSRCYRVSYLVPDLVSGDTLAGPAEVSGLRDLLAAHLSERGTTATVAARFVSVVLADPFRASMLDLAEGTPLLRVESVLHDQSGQPLEVSRAYYGGHSLRVQLS